MQYITLQGNLQWFFHKIFKEAIEAGVKMFYPTMTPHNPWGP
jgi:hypothetical protein